MRLNQWQRAGRRFLFREQETFYREEGIGEAVLCLHGFPTASWDWHRVWPLLTARFRVVAPDLLGYGFSAKPYPYAYSTFEQADRIEALAAELGIAAAHLLAHDYGDTVAQELLARHAERLRRGEGGLRILSLCLLNGGIFPEASRPLVVQRLLAGPAGPLVVRLISERRFRRSLASVFGPRTRPEEEELAEFWRLVSCNRGLRVAPCLARYLDERRRHRERWVGPLKQAPVPLRLVCGLEDPVSGAAIAQRYRQLVPAADVVELPGIGHYPQLEAPDAVVEAFLALVARVHAGAARA